MKNSRALSVPAVDATALLFDIDGTLIDSAGAGGRALHEAFRQQFQQSRVAPVELLGRTDLGIMTELLESHRVAATPENLQLLCERYYELLPQELERSAGRILPGVCEVLVALQERGACYLGLLSGNMRRSARIKLEHFGLWEYFDFGVFGDEARERPLLSVPALTAVAKRSGQQLPAERMVIIGDTPLDIALAQAMGVRCLAVCTGGFDEASLLAAGACRVVADLAQTKNICEWFFLQMELDR